MTRCHRCFNQEKFCICRSRNPESTDYEKARDGISIEMSRGQFDYEPTPTDFVIHKLGGDPSQEGLYLCDQCGIKTDHECDYGGFHDYRQQLDVRFAEDVGE